MTPKLRHTLSALLALTGLGLTIWARVTGLHLTEGELLVSYWPTWLGVFGCGLGFIWLESR
jgi:hypothetical protein